MPKKSGDHRFDVLMKRVYGENLDRVEYAWVSQRRFQKARSQGWRKVEAGERQTALDWIAQKSAGGQPRAGYHHFGRSE